MNLPRFLKIGNKYVPAPKKTKRELLKEVHALLLSDADNLVERKRFSKIDPAVWTDARVNTVYLRLKGLHAEIKKLLKEC